MLLQTASALSVVPLLKSMMVPSEHQSEIAPDAGISGVNAFIHNIKCTFTYDVKPDPVPGTADSASWSDVVSFSRGLYLSLPQESHESVWHMGFVQSGSFFSVTSGDYDTFPAVAAARGLDIRAHYFGPWIDGASFGSISKYGGYTFTYTGELALPRVGPNVGISYATSVSQNYSKVRAFAADFKLSSTTVSGTNFNLSGIFHSGIISDTRYISQVQTDMSSARAAYPPDMLVAQSMTKPDDLGGTEVMKGAIDIMGPDYPRQWCSVDVDATDTLNSQWQSFPYTVASNPFSEESTSTLKVAGPYAGAQLWITPTDTEFYISYKSEMGGKPSNWQKIYYGAINEDGILDIDIGLKAHLSGANLSMQQPAEINYMANFIHVYAYVDQFGNVRYNLASETQRVPLTSFESYSQLSLFGGDEVPPGGGPAVMTPSTKISKIPERIVKSRPRMQRSGMAVQTGGKYLGTLVTLSFVAGFLSDLPVEYGLYAYPGTVRVRARNVDAPGRVGPAHIIRYDGLGVGQQMSFAGTTWLQGIALGQLAPFINNNGTALTVPDNIFSKFVELLWATSPKYRRIMTLSDYNQFVKPYFRDLTLKDLVQSINNLDGETASVVRNLGTAGGFLNVGAGNMLKNAGIGCVTGMVGEGLSAVGQQAGMPGWLSSLGGGVVASQVGNQLRRRGREEDQQ